MTKRKIVKWCLLAGVTLLLTACGSSEAAKKEDVYELSFNIQVPSTHKFHTEVVEPWAKLVEEETDGKVKVNIYNSGALGTLSTAYEDLQGGVYDIGYVSPSLHPDTELFPLSIGDLPFGISNPFDSTAVLKPFMEKYMAESLKEVIPIGISGTDSYQLYSEDPVETIDDVKNKKIIASGYQRVDLIKLWGGVPVSLGLEEIYTSLDRNTVNQATYTSIGAVGLKLYEVSPYLTKIDMGNTALLFLMNKNSFESLPADLQKLFEDELGPKFETMNSELYSSASENAINEFDKAVSENGGRVITLSEKELQSFKEPAKVVWEDWVKLANDKGFNGQEMMDFFTKTLEEEGLTLPY